MSGKRVTLRQVISEVRELEREKWDVTVTWSGLEIRAGRKRLEGVVTDGPAKGCRFGFTRHGLAWVCDRLGMPVEYVSGLDPKMAARLIAYERKRKKVDEFDRAFVLRGWRDLVRGVVSPAYVPIDDLEALLALEEALAGKPVTVRDAFVGLTRTEVRLTLDRVSSDLGRSRRGKDRAHAGLYFVNSEVGAGSLTLSGFVFRMVCSNGMIGGGWQPFFRQRHINVKREEALARFRWAVGEAEQASRQAMEQLGEAVDRPVKGGARFALKQLAVRLRLSRQATEELLRCYEWDPHDSLFGVVNALSRLARSRPQEERFRLERFAAEVLSRPDEAFAA